MVDKISLDSYKHSNQDFLVRTVDFLNLIDLLRCRAKNQPDNTAFTYLPHGDVEETKLTYQELDQKARAVAATLQAMKATGERALLLYQPGLEFIQAFFGCLYADVIVVPVYPPRRNHHGHRLKAIVADAQAKIALTSLSVLSNMEKILQEDSELAKLNYVVTDEIDDSKADDWQLPQVDKNAVAFIQYTSGSTGTPKGVMLSHGSLLYNSQLIYQCFGHSSASRGVIWLPPYHDMGLIGGILQPLYGGFPVTLMSPTAFIKKPFRWLQAISRYRATTSGGPDFAYDLCVQKITAEQRATIDLSSWDVAFTGAEPIRSQTLAAFADTFADCGFRYEAFYPCYGMAETTLIVSGGLKMEAPIVRHFNQAALEQDLVIEATNQHPDHKAIVGCGRAWLNHSIAIVDPKSLIPCPIGRVGEIYVSGSSVAGGYWNQPEQSQKTFHNYLADTPEKSFLRTGDLGFLHNGELFVTGRLKDLIIIAGRNHYPQDIEETVSQCHSALRPGSGAAFSIEVANQERLVIVQELERNYLRQTDFDEIFKAILRIVSERHEIQVYSISLIKTGSLSKTSSGKVQRNACRAGWLSKSLEIVAGWSSNSLNKIDSKTLKNESGNSS